MTTVDYLTSKRNTKRTIHFFTMNDFILNCIIISTSISVSNIISQYIIEVYIRRHTFVTLSEYHEKMKRVDVKLELV